MYVYLYMDVCQYISVYIYRERDYIDINIYIYIDMYIYM